MVEVSIKMWIWRVALLFVIVGMIALLGYAFRDRRANQKMLADNLTLQGTVQSKEIVRALKLPQNLPNHNYVTVIFEKNGKKYSNTFDATEYAYNSVVEGGPVTLIYSAENPSKIYILTDQTPKDLSQEYIVRFILGGITLFLAGLFMWITFW